MDPLNPHLDHIRSAKDTTDATIRILCPSLHRADDAVANTWHRLFDYLCQTDNNPTLEDLNTAAGVIYKLAQSALHLKTLEHKTREFEEKRDLFRQENLQTLRDQPGLAPQLRTQLEQELNLLT